MTYRELLVILVAVFALFLVAIWKFRIAPRLARISEYGTGVNMSANTSEENNLVPVVKTSSGTVAPVQAKKEKTSSRPVLSEGFAERGEKISRGDWYGAYRDFMTHDEIARMFPDAINLEQKRKAYEEK